MLKEVEENSDCHEFISQEEAMKEISSSKPRDNLGFFFTLK